MNDQIGTIVFKIIGNFTGKREIIEDLKIYNNNALTCLYPIFKEEKNTLDVICKNGEKQYLYNTLKGQDTNLDSFVVSLKAQGYNHPSWNDIGR